MDKISKISKITNNIFLGSIEGIRQFILNKYNIFNIVSIICPEYEKIIRERLTKKYNIIFISMHDNMLNKNVFKEKLDIIYPKISYLLDKNKKIFFHCFMGISRSATAVLYVLMRYYSLSLSNAYKLLQKKRPIISPNIGFIKILLDMENKRKTKLIKNNKQK